MMAPADASPMALTSVTDNDKEQVEDVTTRANSQNNHHGGTHLQSSFDTQGGDNCPSTTNSKECDSARNENDAPFTIEKEGFESKEISIPPGLLEDDYSMVDSLDSVSLKTKALEEDFFEGGDHIFQWCNFAGIPRVYQHHAIVLQVLIDDPFCDDLAHTRLRIADFTDWNPQKAGDKEMDVAEPVGTSSSLTGNAGSSHPHKWNQSTLGCIRTYETNATEWRKVKYQAGFLQCKLSRSGTCTQMPCDPPRMVLARVHLLLQNPHLIPFFHSIRSNCECVAFWCKAGYWSTLQASAWLETATAAGQAKSALTALGVMATTASRVTVASSVAGDVMSNAAASTVVQTTSLTAPVLWPALTAYGVLVVGAPLVMFALADRHWKKMTCELNEAFFQATLSNPDLFVECLEHWSTQHENSRDLRKALRMHQQ